MYEDRWSVVSWPTRVRRARPRASSSGSSSRRSTTGPGPPSGSARTASSSWRPPCSSTAPMRRRRATCPPWRRATRSGARGGPSPTPAATWPASARAAARHAAGDGWVLNGQKTWASRGAFAEWCFGIFRTDPDAERHRGLTYFLIPMDAPGVTVRPIPQIDGETGLRRDLLRQRRGTRRPGAGRGRRRLVGRHGHGRLRARPLACAARRATPRRPTASSQLYAARGGAARAPPTRWPRPTWTPRPTSSTPTGRPRGWRAAMRSGPRPAATRSSGPRPTWPSTPPPSTSSAPRPSCSRPGPRRLARRLPLLAGRPIYAGTNEIQRNVVAERLLGLPRG